MESQVECLPENVIEIGKILHYGLLFEQVSLFGSTHVTFSELE
jgi:hypothetical protein